MNAAAIAPLTGVKEFVESEYFAHVEASLAKSTVGGYRKMWNAYGRYFTNCELDMRTCDAQGILRTICADNGHLNKTTLRHIKNFLSGIWAHALRMGCTDRENPWRAVKLPQAPDAGETYAYTPEDIEAILKATPAPYDLVVLLAATTGLRKSEIRGLRWSDWDAASSTLSVNRAVWRSHEKTTKSTASKAPVPVVPVLAERLNKIVSVQHNKLIFEGSTGKPLDLDNLSRRVIIPAVGKTWRGFHAFRRGLATFLNTQGVDDKTIQTILRHESVAVTQACYIKTVPKSAREAMSKVTFGEMK
jgi:integrase